MLFYNLYSYTKAITLKSAILVRCKYKYEKKYVLFVDIRGISVHNRIVSVYSKCKWRDLMKVRYLSSVSSLVTFVSRPLACCCCSAISSSTAEAFARARVACPLLEGAAEGGAGARRSRRWRSLRTRRRISGHCFLRALSVAVHRWAITIQVRESTVKYSSTTTVLYGYSLLRDTIKFNNYAVIRGWSHIILATNAYLPQ